MEPSIRIVRDLVAEKIDELADVSEYWRKSRDKGRESKAIRAAILMIARELLTTELLAKFPEQK